MSMAQDLSLSPPPFAFQQEAAARIRDFLDRKRAERTARNLGAEAWLSRLETLVREVDEALSNKISLGAIRARVAAARDWIVGRRCAALDPAMVGAPADSVAMDPDLLALRDLFDQITRWGRETTIENYSAYLVTVDISI